LGINTLRIADPGEVNFVERFVVQHPRQLWQGWPHRRTRGGKPVQEDESLKKRCNYQCGQNFPAPFHSDPFGSAVNKSKTQRRALTVRIILFEPVVTARPLPATPFKGRASAANRREAPLNLSIVPQILQEGN